MRRSDSGRDGRLAALVGTVLFAAYVAAQRGRILSVDGSIMVNLASRLLAKHTLTLAPSLVDSLHLSSRYTSYGFGTTLLALPFDAVQRAVHPQGASILTLANPAVLAASGSLLFLIGRRLGWRAWVCVATALAFGLVTPALWQSTEMFSEPGVTLGSLAIVLGILSWPDRPRVGPTLVGVGVATAFLFRPDSLVLVVPLVFAAPFLISRRQLMTRAAALACAAPVVLVGIFQLWYNQHRFGSVFRTGIEQQARGRGFDTPILSGLDLLLRSPGRGFFWTSPILLIALPGFVWLYRRNAPIAIAIGGVVATRFVFFAHWWTPGGGVAWGPRLLFPATALLAIPAGGAVERIATWQSARQRRIAWGALGVLTGAGAVVSVLSVAVAYELYWRLWTSAVTKPFRPARVHAYYWSLGHNPIAGNLHLLRAGQPIAPIHFRHSPDLIGVLAVAVAAVAAVVAFVDARPARVAAPA
ncbi:MAG: hypothetical protein ACLPVY_11675 [Acidimicrobiia bacterium]